MSVESLIDQLSSQNRERQQSFVTQAALRPLISQMLNQTRSQQAGVNDLVYRPNQQAGGGPLRGVFQNALQKLVAASGGKVKLGALERSYDEQVRLWNQAVAKHGLANASKWAAHPGHSKHGEGLANDLKYADAATRNWVHQNARNFGLWFPLPNEPWHVEPLGSR